MQLSLFTRLNAVEAELRAMKDLLAELKVNQDELRRYRDEWRWRAERLLANQEAEHGGGGGSAPMQRSTPSPRAYAS